MLVHKSIDGFCVTNANNRQTDRPTDRPSARVDQPTVSLSHFVSDNFVFSCKPKIMAEKKVELKEQIDLKRMQNCGLMMTILTSTNQVDCAAVCPSSCCFVCRGVCCSVAVRQLCVRQSFPLIPFQSNGTDISTRTKFDKEFSLQSPIHKTNRWKMIASLRVKYTSVRYQRKIKQQLETIAWIYALCSNMNIECWCLKNFCVRPTHKHMQIQTTACLRTFSTHLSKCKR